MKQIALWIASAGLAFGVDRACSGRRPQNRPAAQNPSDALAALFAASDEANLRRNPLNALFRGDLRYADRLGDFPSDEYYAAERAAAESELARARQDRPRRP